jgi:hypothetical protein
MPIAQITVRLDDNANFSSNTITSLTPVTVLKQVNLAGRYRARLLAINWCDCTAAGATAPANNQIVTVDSTTWQFPSNGQRGFQFSNKTDHVQLNGPDTPYWEIRNTGANMDITISIQQFKQVTPAAAGPPVVPAVNGIDNAAMWSATQFIFMILTLDLEKIPEN